MASKKGIGAPDAKTLAALDRRLARLFDDEYFQKLKLSIDRGQVPAPIELFFLSHHFGKPRETVALTGADGGPVTVVLELPAPKTNGHG